MSTDLEALRARWDDVRAAARKINPKAGALLTSPNQAYPRSVQDGAVELGFQFPAHVELAGRMTGELAQAIGAVMQREVRVTPVPWPELAEAGTSSSAPPKRGASALVQEAMKHGAEPIDDADA